MSQPCEVCGQRRWSYHEHICLSCHPPELATKQPKPRKIASGPAAKIKTPRSKRQARQQELYLKQVNGE